MKFVFGSDQWSLENELQWRVKKKQRGTQEEEEEDRGNESEKGLGLISFIA